MLKRFIQRIKCFFGFHLPPIGGIRIVEYVAFERFRTESFWMCPACLKRLNLTKEQEAKRLEELNENA